MFLIQLGLQCTSSQLGENRTSRFSLGAMVSSRSCFSGCDAVLYGRTKLPEERAEPARAESVSAVAFAAALVRHCARHR